MGGRYSVQQLRSPQPCTNLTQSPAFWIAVAAGALGGGIGAAAMAMALPPVLMAGIIKGGASALLLEYVRQVAGNVMGGIPLEQALVHNINGRDLAIATAMGALSGGLLSAGSPVATAMAIAGLSSAGARVITDKGNFDWTAMAGMYANGAVAGGLAAAMPWAWGTHIIGGSAIGGVSCMIGDAAGRLTTNLLEGSSIEDTWQDMTKSYRGTFAWGTLFGLGGALGSRFAEWGFRVWAERTTKQAAIAYWTSQSVQDYTRRALSGGLRRQGRMSTALLRTMLDYNSKYEKLTSRAVLLSHSAKPVSNVFNNAFNSNWGPVLFPSKTSPVGH